MSKQTVKRWIEAGKILAEDPSVRVRCPERDDGFLVVHDEALPAAPPRVERHLVCDVCGAKNAILLTTAKR